MSQSLVVELLLYISGTINSSHRRPAEKSLLHERLTRDHRATAVRAQGLARIEYTEVGGYLQVVVDVVDQVRM